MIALKKLYGDELLRLALVLSLLKVDPGDYLHQEAQQLTAGLHISNGTDWSLEHEPRTLIRPRFIHPKSLDNILVNYERELFEELNSLGRYYDRYAAFADRHDNNERMSNIHGVLHTYLVNNVATDTVAPVLVDAATVRDAPVDEYDGVPDDANVAQEVKVSEEEENDTVKEETDSEENPVVTLSPALLHNSTETELFADIASRSFDVAEFLVTPNAMHIKKEPDDTPSQEFNFDTVRVKKEHENDDLYSDNAMDDFVPYFVEKSEKFDPLAETNSVFDQNLADLQDYEETLDTLKEFKSNFEHLDVKQQQENLEQYLLENTPLESEAYDLAPIFEEELVLDVKRERASTSFTSSSSGVSEMDMFGNADVCSDDAVGATETVCSEVKIEPDEGNHSSEELTQEDMDLIEVLWKQDVDMGFSLDDPMPLAPHATKVELGSLDAGPEHMELEQEKLEQEKNEKIEMVKASLLDVNVTPKEDDPWAGLSYTVDTETGEYVLQGELPGELGGEESRFDLLEEALGLVELADEAERPPPDAVSAAVQPSAASEPSESGAMLHPAMARHALPHPHHHHLAHYHNQSIMRTMSVEQRWQDLASLLTIPPPPEQYPPYQHHQHPHNISSGHGSAGGYAPNYGPMAPPHADKHPDAYGAAAPLEGAYKVESAHHPQQHDPVYYQPPQNGQADMGGNPDGFLQSILNDEDLQLMDMAMNEGMYTMRMLDGAVGGAHAPPPPHTHAHTHMMVNERDSASDSAVSSMGSERVPSLSDGEWCDGNDSAQEYHSSKFRPYEASCGRERPPGVSQPAQKKHHMFGKRCFQEPTPASLESIVPEIPRPQPVVKYEYPEHHYHRDVVSQPGAPLLPVDYGPRHQPMPHHAHMPAMQPTLDLHSAHSSGHGVLQNPGAAVGARYGAYATPERVRHNHTYSAPLAAVEPRPPARDKRVRRMTDGSMSDSSSTPSAGGGHLSRDEKRAKALGIPLTVHDIINLPMDEFNERLSKHDLSEAQLSLIRDIRRRGKNKVAAQNCRKRKLDQITSLADEVRTVRDRKQRLQRDRQSLLSERQRVKDRFAALYRHVFQNLRDVDGRPVSSAQYSLQQAADGNVVLVPKMPHPSDHMNRSSDDEMDRKTKNFEQ